MHMKKILFFLFCLLAVTTHAYAQSEMNVAPVFGNTTLGKGQKEIIIKGRELKPYNLEYFRSQTLKTTPGQRDAIEKLVKADGQEAADKEIGTIGGHIYYAFYCFRKTDGSYSYLFYRNNTLRNRKSQEITLIYMEGHATLEQLKKMFN